MDFFSMVVGVLLALQWPAMIVFTVTWVWPLLRPVEPRTAYTLQTVGFVTAAFLAIVSIGMVILALRFNQSPPYFGAFIWTLMAWLNYRRL